jgi:hypothetical protein
MTETAHGSRSIFGGSVSVEAARTGKEEMTGSSSEASNAKRVVSA